jgi:hypothetical protein
MISHLVSKCSTSKIHPHPGNVGFIVGSNAMVPFCTSAGVLWLFPVTTMVL